MPVNFFSVLVAAIINMALGMLWYSPTLFGKMWVRAMGKTEKDMEGMRKEANKAYFGSFVTALLMSYVLAQFVAYAGASTFSQGAVIGFWLWLGFVLTTGLAPVLFEGRSKTTFFINTLYNLVALILMGALLALWR